MYINFIKCHSRTSSASISSISEIQYHKTYTPCVISIKFDIYKCERFLVVTLRIFFDFCKFSAKRGALFESRRGSYARNVRESENLQKNQRKSGLRPRTFHIYIFKDFIKSYLLRSKNAISSIS